MVLVGGADGIVLPFLPPAFTALRSTNKELSSLLFSSACPSIHPSGCLRTSALPSIVRGQSAPRHASASLLAGNGDGDRVILAETPGHATTAKACCYCCLPPGVLCCCRSPHCKEIRPSLCVFLHAPPFTPAASPARSPLSSAATAASARVITTHCSPYHSPSNLAYIACAPSPLFSFSSQHPSSPPTTPNRSILSHFRKHG